jgi:hypothetical protein
MKSGSEATDVHRKHAETNPGNNHHRLNRHRRDDLKLPKLPEAAKLPEDAKVSETLAAALTS